MHPSPLFLSNPPTLDPLIALGRGLAARDYRFITITPSSHQRVNARAANAEACRVRDIFGWNRSFRLPSLDPELHELALAAGVLIPESEGRWRSAVRFSTIGHQLYVHSGFPTDQHDAVFFGPDTYRFVTLLQRSTHRVERALDLGCGSGAGGLSMADQADHLVLSDINPVALRYAQVNAALAGVTHAQIVESDLFSNLEGSFDLIVANPPYLADNAGRAYRDGGGTLGTDLSKRMVQAALPRLRPGGRLVLYTAAPITEGRDMLYVAICPLWASRPVASNAAFSDENDSYSSYEIHYEELDPDVFGEELEQPNYAHVDRLALVSLVVERSR